MAAMTQAQVLNKLRTINGQLTNRVVDYGSPEGDFLEAVSRYRPYSPELIEQLIAMVDIQFKSETREKRDFTSHSPCASALVVGLADPLPVIDAALERPNLPPAVKPVLAELRERVIKGLAGKKREAERKKQREESKAHPKVQQTEPPSSARDQWPFPTNMIEPRTETRQEAPPLAPSGAHEPSSSTPWTVIVISIIAASGLLWLLLKNRK